MTRSARSRGALALLALVAGCNTYDAFLLTGYAQEGFTNRADVLFIIDNTATMTDDAYALAINFDTFINEFTVPPPAQRPTLADEVQRYVDYLTDRSGNLNYHLGMTTSTAALDRGALLGEPTYLTPTTPNLPATFNANLLCETACITTAPPVDVTCPGGRLPDPADACADGTDVAPGGGELREEPLEAVFLALCGAVDNPPEACFQDWWWQDDIREWRDAPPPELAGTPDEPDPVEYFSDADARANKGFLRPNGVLIPVIITDEGDQSRRVPFREPRVDEYLELFRRFGNRTSVAVIGPNRDCNQGGAADWTIERLERTVSATNGVYVDISVPNNAGTECIPVDFAEALGRVGELLRGLADTFPLRSVPVDGSIVVTVDGAPVPEASCRFDEDLGAEVCVDGWAYDAPQNSVRLYGDAVPDFDADVQVFYLPSDGVPRTLPF